MFLNAVIIIVQEILEAALLISVLLVFTYLFQKVWGKSFILKTSWVAYSIVLGVIGAALYSHYTGQVSQWFDYVGQEIVNASIHIISLFLILLLAFAVPPGNMSARLVERSRLTTICMIGIVLLAIIREGSEIMLYAGGVASQPENFTPVVFGAVIGGGIGVSAGVLLYYGLISLNAKWAFRVCLILLALISGNMGSQAVLLLTQADWLPFTPIAWNTSSILAEASIPGHLLYALIGYEATPSVLQVGFYLFGIVMIVLSPLFRKTWSSNHSLVTPV
ncbi:MAG: iron permease [SAR86 cluster bacterium]|uniref:Iron permease n=1 Tax=SAR86 cluster bacterium TaxID=2030880 RepID=A0A2A5AXK5_9GAMM|nr:MAG: iron permease [SAR86 cluster bacterium]